MRALEDCWQQTYKNLEILIIDQTDTLSFAMADFYKQNAKRLRVIRMKTKGLGQARNRALKEAKGEIILYLDDDVYLYQHLVKLHARHYANPKVGAVVGRVDDAGGDPPTLGGRVNWYGEVRLEHDVRTVHQVESLSGGNMSIRVDLLKQIGGFWELDGNLVQMREETDAALRIRKAGYQVIGDPEASIVHLAIRSGGTRTAVDRISWYEDLFFAEFSYFLRNFSKFKLPLYILVLARPILACSFYYGKGSWKGLSAPWKGLSRAWQATQPATSS